MAFEVEIAVKGAAAAKAAVASLGTEFERTEQKSTKAKDSMSRFGGVVSGLDRARQATQGLAGAQNALEQGFAGVAVALQREADMLERIHGPMRRHAADMQALQHLYQRGAISAREYTSEVERMNRAVGVSKGGGGAGLAALGAVGGALVMAREVGELSNSYTNLGNRIRQVSRNESEHNALMERTKEIANATRSEWSATGEAFVRLTNATKDMGLGQERVLRLTETINKAFSMSGASSAEASAGMLQLSQAFASGRLQGDEFRTLAEAVPSILDMIAKEMGVTRGSLKQLGSEGKITADVLVKAFENAQGSIDNGFAKSVPTLSQQWTVFKNDLTEGANALAQIVFPSVVSVVKDLVSQVNALAGAAKKVLDLLPDGVGPSSDFADYARSVNPVSQIQNLEKLVGESEMSKLSRQHKEKIDGTTENTAALAKFNVELAESLKISERLSKLDAPTSQNWLGVTYGKDNPLETLRMAMEGFTEASDASMANMSAGWPDAMKHFVSSTAEAFDFLRPAAQGFFEVDLPNWVDASTSAFDRLGSSAGGTLKSVMTKLGIGGNTGWGGLSDDEVRAGMGKRSGARGRSRAQAHEATNIWRSSSPISDALFGPDFANEVSGMLSEVKTQLNAFQSWEQAAATEDNFFTRMISAGRDLIEETERNNERLTDNWKRTLSALNEKPTIGLGAEQSLREFVEGFETAGQVIKKAMTTSLEGIENAIIRLADTGRLELGDLAKELRNLFIRSAIRGTAAQFLPSIPGVGGGGADGGGGSPQSARVNPDASPTFHIVFDEGMQHAAAVSPRGQANTVNVVYKQHGAYLAVRDRLRSRS